MVSSWSVSMAEGDGATLFAVHEQYALLIVFYVLCEYIKMNVNTTPPVSLEDFFDWISERIVKLGQNIEQNLWNCLLGFLNEEANQMANDEPSMSALSGASWVSILCVYVDRIFNKFFHMFRIFTSQKSMSGIVY